MQESHMNEERADLTHAQIQKFYDEVYYRDAKVSAKIPAHLRRLARKLGIGPGQKVLDVACGAGDWLSAVRERGALTAGIDLSHKAITLCRARLPEGVFHAGPAERLPFTDGEFDLVTCLGSLEHFVDPQGALQEMRRVARADARFVLLVPNTGFLTHRLGLYRGTCQNVVIERARDLDEWLSIFESAGLRVMTRWRDLHVLSWSWINRGRWYHVLLRALQALLLVVWPLSWQYQVYHLCTKSDARH
jgi:ubiquinone/menaquinone biosynthesis C-methylase UbiE